MVDYSKWDKLNLDSSSDEEQPPERRSQSATRSSPSMAASRPAPRPWPAVSPIRRLCLEVVDDLIVAMRALTAPEDAGFRGQLAACVKQGQHALATGTDTALQTLVPSPLTELRTEAHTRLANRAETAALYAKLGDGWEDAVSALKVAALMSELATLRAAFCTRRPPVDSCMGGGLQQTWLHFAADACGADVVRCLLALGAPLEARNVFGDTPLLGAAREGNPVSLEALLAAGADVAATNNTDSTALHLAALGKQTGAFLRCVQLLMAAGAPVNARSRGDGLTPAMFAVKEAFSPLTVLELVSANARSPEVDMSLLTTQLVPETLLSMALEPSGRLYGAVVRQLVVAEAYWREMECRGSGDPTNLLGLHGGPRPTPPLRLRQQQGDFSFFGRTRLVYVPDSDAAVPPAAKAHQLPRCGRVLRYDDGASVANKFALAPSELIAPPRDVALEPLRALLAALHARLGADSPARTLTRDAAGRIATLLLSRRRSCAPCCGVDGDAAAAAVCACVASGWPCFPDCPRECTERNPLNVLELPSGGARLTACAADHLSVVRSLSAAQLAALYPLACTERWGARQHGGHVTQAGSNGVQLSELLQPSAPCATCRGRGMQFFSFCLNRPVNSDRVAHCLACGRCFYFRPGFMHRACPYCACDPRGAAEAGEAAGQGDVEKETEQREWLQADAGYWGR